MVIRKFFFFFDGIQLAKYYEVDLPLLSLKLNLYSFVIYQDFSTGYKVKAESTILSFSMQHYIFVSILILKL